MAVFSGTFSLIGSSWRIFMKDKELILFSVISVLCQLVFVAGAAAVTGLSSLALGGSPQDDSSAYGLLPMIFLAVAALGLHVIGNFFTGAIVASAARRLSGENPTVGSGITDAFKHLPSLVGWALLETILSMAMSAFRNKGWIRQMIGGLIEASFRVLSFFTLPLIMMEDLSPFEALSRSSQMLGKTWGNQIIAGASFRLLYFAAVVPVLVLTILAGVASQNGAAALFLAGLFIIYFVIVWTVIRTLHEIFRAALFLYVRDQKAPAGFDAERLRLAFTPA